MLAHRFFPVLFALALVAPALSHAAGAAPAGKSAVLLRLDPDSDGTVSLDEAKAAAAARFEALDTDQEGTLDAGELTGILSKRGLAKADSDKDGTLDKAEFTALAVQYFQKADKDKDGTLDAKELNSPAGRALVALLGG